MDLLPLPLSRRAKVIQDPFDMRTARKVSKSLKRNPTKTHEKTAKKPNEKPMKNKKTWRTVSGSANVFKKRIHPERHLSFHFQC